MMRWILSSSLAATLFLAALAPSSAAPIAATPIEVKLPSFGVALAAPAGWVRAREPSSDIIAQWVKLSTGGNQAIAVLRMQILPRPDEVTLAEVAADVAAHSHAVVSDPSVRLGGSSAVEITGTLDPTQHAPADRGTMALAVGRIAQHAHHMYGLYYLTLTGSGPRQPFDDIANSLHWTDFIRPEDALTARDPTSLPFPLFNLRITFLLPDPYRLVESQAGQEVYATFDYIHNKPGAKLTVARAAAHGANLAKLESVIDEETDKKGWINRPAWTMQRASVGYCGLINRPAAANGHPAGPLQFIVALTNDGSYVLLQFEYPAIDPNDHSFSGRQPPAGAPAAAAGADSASANDKYAAEAAVIAASFTEPKLIVTHGQSGYPAAGN